MFFQYIQYRYRVIWFGFPPKGRWPRLDGALKDLFSLVNEQLYGKPEEDEQLLQDIPGNNHQ